MWTSKWIRIQKPTALCQVCKFFHPFSIPNSCANTCWPEQRPFMSIKISKLTTCPLSNSRNVCYCIQQGIPNVCVCLQLICSLIYLEMLNLMKELPNRKNCQRKSKLSPTRKWRRWSSNNCHSVFINSWDWKIFHISSNRGLGLYFLWAHFCPSF